MRRPCVDRGENREPGRRLRQIEKRIDGGCAIREREPTVGALEVGHPGGSRERITPEAWADLSAQMRVGAISRLKDAQAYLRERWGISYCLDGISKLFIRRKTKLKTGRPRHRDADAAAQAAFKKSVRRHA
jgi:transposase